MTEEQKVIEMANRLLLALFIPSETGWVRDSSRCEHFGVINEPINWGSLRCFDAKKFEDGSWLLTIDEAAPGGCPMLCAYIERYMLDYYGFNVSVNTEW